MKKQFTKIKIAAENLSRSNKPDRKDFELETIEKQVDKYRDVLDKMVRKLPAVSSTTDTQERDKRIKKNSHYKIGQALEESSKELTKDLPLHHVLSNCGELEKSIAECIVDSELETETEVVRRLKLMLDNEIQEISTLKRNVTRTMQEYTSLKRNYEAAIRLEEPTSKINHIKEQQEQCEVKLEKERDSWAAQMFELIAKEDEIVQCIRDYVLNQRTYHERALHKVNASLAGIQDVLQSTVKSRFGTSLETHLESSHREISYILELCICCLVENGLYEEGLLRVGCASTKLRRMKHALEAQYVKTPLPLDYQDPHVIGSILKLFLRELPEPLLTYRHYKDFIRAAEHSSESERRADIKAILAKLPATNYANLRYLTKFLWLVTQNVDQNKMNSQNLAIVMSPNMLWPRVDKNHPADYLGQVNSSSAVNVIVELLISQWEYFFDGDVDFFVTLQRNKLFVEGKSKSNSSNEHLDRHDGDSLESVRYGTIRRQKACAPSPPAKAADKPQSNAVTPLIAHANDAHDTPHSTPVSCHVHGHSQRNGVKELFPAANHGASDRPEKPPLPKQLQLQLQQTTTTPATQEPSLGGADQLVPKPVPMTRTQFFGLDNLPSPVADRKSTDSAGSVNAFKPDLPQKPKIPKRPIVLGLNSANKSDDETTPTQPAASDEGSGGIHDNGSATRNGNGHVRNSTERFIEKLRAENCDNSGVSKEIVNTNQREQNQLMLHAEQLVINAANASSQTYTSTIPTGTSTSSEISAGTATASADRTVAPPAAVATTTTATNTISASTTSNHATQTEARNPTPTTPVSPNMILTPKRPTVPAPPPPSVVKKQIE